ncbi:hypothetical protein [Roseibium sp.]|uniref:hypothetical protein n=1 Tax=Roseibium sp. TaxID=1936156 RepID=UPI003D106FAD
MKTKFLHTFIGRFPDREREIALLERNNPAFRSICEEIEMAEVALAHWKDVPQRASEYQAILDRLQDEFLEHLSTDPRKHKCNSPNA